MELVQARQKNLCTFLLNIGLLSSAILLFGLPQPNLLRIQGFPFLAYFAFLPLFLLVRRVLWKTVWLWGIAYGIGCYCFFTYWLGSFHPMGLIVIASMYGIYLMIALPILKAAASLFPKWGWLVQWVVWCSYEYVKTLGFSGFHYGVMGYSQWQFTLLTKIADITGIWGISALVCFPSAWLCGACVQMKSMRDVDAFKKWIKKNQLFAYVWGLLILLSLVYGVFSQVDYKDDQKFTVALIQTNSDPWVGGTETYKKDLQVLKELSAKAIEENPAVDLVVWPETAFIPRIDLHYRLRKERDKYELVDDLLHFLNRMTVTFVIGNDHGVQGYNRLGIYDIIDYNAVLLFKPTHNVIPPNPDKYFKMKLVPFTEYFPFEKIFPKLYELLLNGDTHLWTPGNDPVVFTVAGLTFGTPICFEDTFGFVGRRFVNAGAQAFVNLSNDSWSKSLPCQYQHISMAVFRSIENRVPSVRSTSSGQTAIIDPNGKITAMAKPFTATYLVGDIPIRSIEKKTLYTRYGDYLGIFFAFLSSILIIGGCICKVKCIKSK